MQIAFSITGNVNFQSISFDRIPLVPYGTSAILYVMLN